MRVFVAGWRLWRAGFVTIDLGIDAARGSIVIGAKVDDLYAARACPVGAVRGTAAHWPRTRRSALILGPPAAPRSSICVPVHSMHDRLGPVSVGARERPCARPRRLRTVRSGGADGLGGVRS